MLAKYTPTAITWLPGDVQVVIPGLTKTVDGFYAECQGFQQKRGAAIVATFLLKDMTRLVLTGATPINGSTPICLLVEEFKMAAQAATMTDVTLDGDTYTFQFGPEGFPKTLADLELMRSEVQSQDMVKKVAIVNAYAKSNGGADMTQMVGIPVTIDFDANQPIQIGE